MMFDGNLVVCKKCRNQAGFTSFIDVATEKCDCCGGDLLDTGKTEDEWDELFERCSDPNKGTAPWEWAAEQALKNSTAIDNNLVNTRLEMEELELQKTLSKPHCPKCYSTNLSKTKRGFSTGRAVAAGMLTGFLDVAAVAGAAGSNKMINCCNDCGHTWK